ncbi:hypothetical protein Celaphus_00000547 [Cervus elaphus hippelaphus]|uniref:ABC transmembrane type-1 domain-containing protein n=1 Tax=Cervus elaphus hippelaphus TaxID=46360 RepID=A0A212D6V4_CEREH|nr:hypothetical protein Celaphus_00000547 [Cervus elaphus hippelaphus]
MKTFRNWFRSTKCMQGANAINIKDRSNHLRERAESRTKDPLSLSGGLALCSSVKEELVKPLLLLRSVFSAGPRGVRPHKDGAVIDEAARNATTDTDARPHRRSGIRALRISGIASDDILNKSSNIKINDTACLFMMELAFEMNKNSKEGTKVVLPIFLGKIISYVENYHLADPTALHEAYSYAAGLSACVLMWAVLHHLYFYHIQCVGMRLRVATCHMIYRKVTMFLHYLWVGPLQAVAVTALLWMEIGMSCLAGMAVLIILLLLQSCFGMLFSSLRDRAVPGCERGPETSKVTEPSCSVSSQKRYSRVLPRLSQECGILHRFISALPPQKAYSSHDRKHCQSLMYKTISKPREKRTEDTQGWLRPPWNQHSRAWTGAGGLGSSRTPPPGLLNFRVSSRGWGGAGEEPTLQPREEHKGIPSSNFIIREVYNIASYLYRLCFHCGVRLVSLARTQMGFQFCDESQGLLGATEQKTKQRATTAAASNSAAAGRSQQRGQRPREGKMRKEC